MSTPDLKKVFAKNLRSIRGNRTQKQMAILLGTTQQAYDRWERGIVAPRLKTLQIISARLGVNESDLMNEMRVSAGDVMKETAPPLRTDQLPIGEALRRNLVSWSLRADLSVPEFMVECLRLFGKHAADQLQAERAPEKVVAIATPPEAQEQKH